MQTLVWKNHIELNAEMGMINLTDFSLTENINDPDSLIESFIRSTYYWKDCRNDYVKANPNGGFTESVYFK
jgi:hypothetical protein